ncbi:SDR family NAD(P)-dependent oxidoreductase [Maricaulis sp.]|jgi:NAD(P)-dependent dehydrogenase (short-subunit alcohol dehydrogenase family)|uniref:SDR family NAD(P)-dependent oxidoreductase n=2 Tax=Maricaulis sp. TaxID=1486257 RepID=UPI001B1812EB|nr:SDR family NAD(P)-dependent oxidoreductase [Maricaulis sp.]MBO6764368.1 SDR family NAD(P)-dependent oxidoreductase [Maricaulis sp.]MED5547993.1 SDR family NAD(P)-dependent oxidoreductase [Pseudomonadota bacterium]
MTDIDLKGRLALVSGASRGIGRALALELAKAGAHVIATARTQGALEELDDAIKAAGGTTTLVPMDLMSEDGIEQLGQIVTDRWGKLDIMIANAGALGELTPAAQVKAKTWQNVLGVNLVAPARMIRAFEGPLLSSDAGRAVFISSGAASSRRAFWAPYAAAKSGLDALAQSWAAEHVNSPSLRINVVYPGAMRTRMRAKAFPGEDPNSLPEPAALWPLVAELVGPDCARHGEIVRFEG